MERAWKALVDAGVPSGAPRPPPRTLRAAEVKRALRDVERRLPRLAMDRRETLHAWLRALRHHWPKAFREISGARGERLIRRLGPARDPNRYLKLRRIAIENLAGIV